MRYGAGVGAWALALALTLAFEPYLSRSVFVLFWPAIVVAAWYGGIGPALVTLLLSVLGVQVLVMPPERSALIHDPRDLVALATFAVFATGVALLTDRLRHTRTKARRAEQEATERALQLQDQAAELEAQAEEAQALAEELEQSNEQLRSLMAEAEAARRAAERAAHDRSIFFDALPDSVILFDPEWRVEHLNPAAAERLRAVGAAPETVRGRTLQEVVGAEHLVWLRREGKRASEERRLVEFEEPSRLSSRAFRHRIIPTDTGFILHSRDVTAERRRAIEQQALADAGTLLASPMDVDATVAAIVDLAVPGLADWCSVTLARDDGRLEPVAVAHSDPAKVAWARELARRYPTDPRAATGVANVLRTGRAEFLPTVTDAMLVAAARDEEHLRMMREIGFTSAILVPLAARSGTLGVLTMVTAESRRQFTPADLALAEELGRRIGIALENASLYAAERGARTAAEAAAARIQRLHSVTAALSHATTVDEVVRVAAEHGMSALGAADGVVCLVTADGTALDIVHERGLPTETAAAFRRFPIDAPLPLSDAVRSSQAIFLADRADVVRRYPALAAANREARTEAWVLAPLVGDRGALGGIAFGFLAPRDFSPEERDLIVAITRQCAIALERARALEAERTARAEAERANLAKTDFLAVMSHELRTPLNAIAGHTELVELGIHGPVTEAQREALSRVRRSQRHLLGLINDVLNFAKLEAGHVEYAVEDVPLHDAVEALEALVSSQLRAKALRFVPCGCESRPEARADAEKVRQILLNLLSNAIKFTPEGGTITVRCVIDEAGGNRVGVRVSDTGIGIAPDKREQIFAPFVQVDRKLHTSHEGTGLGLAISRDLARGMGGDLVVESIEGEGSSFTLLLPAGSRGAD